MVNIYFRSQARTKIIPYPIRTVRPYPIILWVQLFNMILTSLKNNAILVLKFWFPDVSIFNQLDAPEMGRKFLCQLNNARLHTERWSARFLSVGLHACEALLAMHTRTNTYILRMIVPIQQDVASYTTQWTPYKLQVTLV